MNQGSSTKRVLIVESSAKTKTLTEFLRGEYRVIACGGHIADLPKAELGVAVERYFELAIEPVGQKVETLRNKLRNVDEVYLASDPDREGEAIAADLLKFCVPPGTAVKRVTFNSITYHAVNEALKAPRDVDGHLVTAQRARRALDRLIGFILSSISKFDPAGPECPAVGRVIVPATMLVVTREKEREEFTEETFYRLKITLCKSGCEFILTSTEKWVDSALAEAKKQELLGAGVMRVTGLDRNDSFEKNPFPPFSTTDLQETAERYLSFNPARTMKLAQRLYEGIEIEGKHTALITYMRTDSTRVSPEAMGMARKAIETHPDLGEGYYKGRPWVATEGTQDAHEAIRPVHPEREGLRPDELRSRIDEDLWLLYNLIYCRFLCSQVRPATYNKMSIEAEASGIKARADLYQLRSDGFLRLYRQIDEAAGLPETTIPELAENMETEIEHVIVEEDTTKPPLRYSEGSLVRALKEKGIGRPSTYSPTIEKIKKYSYVRRRGNRLLPTDKGKRLCRYLMNHYEQVTDLSYTSGMEQKLDRIASGDLEYETFLEDEWRWIEPAYRRAMKEGWLNSDLPSRAQVAFLEKLADESGEEIPEEVWLSSKLTSEWIEKLLGEQPTRISLSAVTGPEDVGGVQCYACFVYYSGPMPDEEKTSLREHGFRYVQGGAVERLGYRLRRQSKSVVDEKRNLLLDRYTGTRDPWLKDVEIEICD